MDLVFFVAPMGHSPAPSSVQADVSMFGPNAAMIARDLFVQATGAPSMGQGRQFQIVANGSPLIGCTMQGDGETSCNSGAATGMIPAAAEISLRVTNQGSPSTTNIKFGWRATSP
jgi:hypothetical protein